MSGELSLIDQFISITGATSAQAKFYIESTDGQLDLAVTQYYDTAHSTVEDNIPVARPAVHDELLADYNNMDELQPNKRTRTSQPANTETVSKPQNSYNDTLIDSHIPNDYTSNTGRTTARRRDPFVSYQTQIQSAVARNEQIWNDDRYVVQYNMCL